MRDVAPTERANTATAHPAPAPVAQAPVTPPPTPTPASATPAVSLAASLAALQDTGTLEAIVVGVNAQGRTVLRTEAGSFALSSAIALKAGERVLLQLIGGASGLRANILRVNDRLLTPAPNVALLALAEPKAGAAPLPQAPADPALILPNAAEAKPQAPPAAAPGQATPGAKAALAANPAPLTPAILVAAPASSAASSPAISPLPALPLGSQLSLRLGEITPAAAPAGGGANASVAAGAVPPVMVSPKGERIFTGVVGTLADGRPGLLTPLGALAIDLPDRPAPGSRVEFQIAQILLPALAPAPAGETPVDALIRLGRDWPALAQTLAVMQEIDPLKAQRLSAHALPQANARLGAAALFLFAAIRGNGLTDWLGQETVQRLADAGQSAVVQRLQDDFAQLNRLADDRAVADWRVLMLPVFDGHELRQAVIYYRHNKKSGQEDQDGGTRFVLEISLHATGELQFDGLIRAKRFDLILRSEREISDNWRRDITEIFNGALGLGGLAGNLSFQAGGKRVLQPLEDLRQGVPHSGVKV